MNNKPNSTNTGLAALFTVVVIGAAALIMSIGASLLGLLELNIGYTDQQGASAFALADACQEEALRRIKIDNTHGIGQGSFSLTLPNGVCQYQIINLGVGGRQINSTGNLDNKYYKQIQSQITISGSSITVNSWQEI